VPNATVWFTNIHDPQSAKNKKSVSATIYVYIAKGK
jgi:hypothetical protein